jgi:hypothetical protein
MPGEWSSALSKTTVSIPKVLWFATEAVDSVGGTAYGTYHTANAYGVGGVDLATGALRKISSKAASAWGGVLWMSASNPWLVWAESLPSLTGAWDLRAWNIHTGESRLITSSRLLAGQETFPIARQNYVAWSQATSGTSADIRIYHFSNRTTTNLDSGHLSPPVVAGRYLVWAKYLKGEANPTFQMVDSGTLVTEAVPAVLSAPGPITYLAGSSDYLAWTKSATVMAAYDLNAGKLSTYQMAQRDGRHAFQFPMLAGRILVWWSGVQDTIVDLATGNGFDVIDGAAAGSSNLLVVSGAKGNVPTLSALHLLPNTGITVCAR